jgi:hypothetical protein
MHLCINTAAEEITISNSIPVRWNWSRVYNRCCTGKDAQSVGRQPLMLVSRLLPDRNLNLVIHAHLTPALRPPPDTVICCRRVARDKQGKMNVATRTVFRLARPVLSKPSPRSVAQRASGHSERTQLELTQHRFPGHSQR